MSAADLSYLCNNAMRMYRDPEEDEFERMPVLLNEFRLAAKFLTGFFSFFTFVCLAMFLINGISPNAVLGVCLSLGLTLACAALVIIDKIEMKKLIRSGLKVRGEIISVGVESKPRGPYIIRYSYEVKGVRMEGATSTIRPLDELPKEGDIYTVHYRESNPSKSVIEV